MLVRSEMAEQQVLKFVIFFPVSSEKRDLCVQDFGMLHCIRHRVPQVVNFVDDVVELVDGWLRVLRGFIGVSRSGSSDG